MPKVQDKNSAPTSPAAERTVSVSASGFAAAEPDIAHVSTGVVSEAETAHAALMANSSAMQTLIDGLKGLGIAAKDIQTISFNIEPRYPSKPAPGGAPQITGYRVVNQVRVTARQIDRLGELLDRLVGLGANQMHGLAFEVSKAEALKDEARKAAIANALRRAKLFASATGAEVGQVLVISEGVTQGATRVGAARSAMLESVPIERGSQSLEVSVSVTWALL